jgi:hypothetical protein
VICIVPARLTYHYPFSVTYSVGVLGRDSAPVSRSIQVVLAGTRPVPHQPRADLLHSMPYRLQPDRGRSGFHCLPEGIGAASVHAPYSQPNGSAVFHWIPVEVRVAAALVAENVACANNKSHQRNHRLSSIIVPLLFLDPVVRGTPCSDGVNRRKQLGGNRPVKGACLLLHQMRVASLGFWFVGVRSLMYPVHFLSAFGLSPITIVALLLQILLTWVLPYSLVGFHAATFILREGAFAPLGLAALVVGPVFLVPASLVWSAALRRYRSTGS